MSYYDATCMKQSRLLLGIAGTSAQLRQRGTYANKEYCTREQFMGFVRLLPNHVTQLP